LFCLLCGFCVCSAHSGGNEATRSAWFRICLSWSYNKTKTIPFNHLNKQHMCRINLLLPLLLLALNVLAQNPHLDYRFAVKLNNLSSYEEHRTSEADTTGHLYRYATDAWQ